MITKRNIYQRWNNPASEWFSRRLLSSVIFNDSKLTLRLQRETYTPPTGIYTDILMANTRYRWKGVYCFDM